MKWLLMLMISFSCFATPLFNYQDRVKIKTLSPYAKFFKCSNEGKVIKLTNSTENHYSYDVKHIKCMYNETFIANYDEKELVNVK